MLNKPSRIQNVRLEYERKTHTDKNIWKNIQKKSK